MVMQEYPDNLPETEMEQWESQYANADPNTRAFVSGIVDICLGVNSNITVITNVNGRHLDVDRFDDHVELQVGVDAVNDAMFIHPPNSIEHCGDSGDWSMYYVDDLPDFIRNLFRFHHLAMNNDLAHDAQQFLTRLLTPLEVGEEEEEEEEEDDQE